MAALTCSYSSCSPATSSSWKEAATLVEPKPGLVVSRVDVAVNEEAKQKYTSKLISRRRSEEGGAGEEEVWEGVVRREIGAGVDEVWDMVGQFGGMKRWNTIAEVCELVEGAEGEVGCVRYCAGGGRWVKEKLLEVQPAQRSFTYTIIDSSYGFQGYIATLAILPLQPSQALAHWTFQLNPVPDRTPNEVLDLLTFIFDRMMSSLEGTILSSSSPAPAAAAPPPAAAAAAGAN